MIKGTNKTQQMGKHTNIKTENNNNKRYKERAKQQQK